MEKSQRLKVLLFYICERSIQGRLEELKEQKLGEDVFGRGPGFSPKVDNIVRVEVRQLRKRLEEFFATEGKDEPIVLMIPRGAYCAVFLPRDSAAASPQTKPSLRRSAQPAEPFVMPIPESVNPRSFYSPATTVLAGTTFLFLVLTIFLWHQNRGLQTFQSSLGGNAAHALPWSAILTPGHRTEIVLSDAYAGASRNLTGANISLEEYASLRYSSGDSGRDLPPTARFLLERHLIPVQDVGVAVGMARTALASGYPASVRSARDLRAQDFRTDDSFVLIGCAASNPWVSLFEKQADFSVEFDPAHQDMVCRNKRPRPGEAALYVPASTGPASADSYSAVSLLRNLNQEGHILLIAGTTGEATEAAGRFVTNQRLLSNALRRGGLDPAGPPSHFEALLRVKTMAGSPGDFDVIAFHTAAEDTAR